MPEKEDISHSLAILFIIVSMTLLFFLLPFDTLTGSLVFDLPAEKIKEGATRAFYDYYIVYALILVIVSVLLVGGLVHMESEKKKARKLLLSLPARKRLELKRYVSETIRQGYTEDHIREALLKEGWNESHVDSILRLF